MMQTDNHIFKGMRRDDHPSRQDSSYLWDAYNIRLTNRDTDTGFAITNERGNTMMDVYFEGNYVGHCVLNDYLVVFTTQANPHIDRIYRVTRKENRWINITLFEGDLNLDTNHPLETLGDSETTLINKVYWTDGINQPRVINITALELKAPEYVKVGLERVPWEYDRLNLSDLSKSPNSGGSGGQDVQKWYEQTGRTSLYSNRSFDFVQTLKLEEEVYITKVDSYGEFAPGVIQYALTYFNKYGQESNIFYVSPLQYISTEDRAGSPEEKINNSFKITITNPDDFDYIRIYSIHRTSLDAIPTVKIVADLSLENQNPGVKVEPTIWVNKGDVIQDYQLRSIETKTVEYIDTGLTGSIEDPSKLLYVGGQSILGGTLAVKNGTMFLGDITLQQNSADLIDTINTVKADTGDQCLEFDNDQLIQLKGQTGENNIYYPYKPVYDNPYFKAGETYRLGLQFQFNTGQWSSPIPLNELNDIGILDTILNNTYPWVGKGTVQTGGVHFVSPKLIQTLYDKGVRNVRTCVVLPKPSERTIVCQGVLAPTVFNVGNRSKNNPFVQSSWFFRPAHIQAPSALDVELGSNIAYGHNTLLYAGNTRSAEIQNMRNYGENKDCYEVITDENYRDHTSAFAVDRNIVTMHSPEIEYGSDIANSTLLYSKLRMVGVARLHNISGTNDLAVSSTRGGSGFTRPKVGYAGKQKPSANPNGGLVSYCCFNDYALYGSWLEHADKFFNFLVYPWHRQGSLNNDLSRPQEIINVSGNRTAMLKWKITANLKYFESESALIPPSWQGIDPKDNIDTVNITTPQVFNSNEVTGINIHIPYLDTDVLYYGNVDDIIKSNFSYPIYVEGDNHKIRALSDPSESNVTTSNDPVRMKYKSSPHLVFSLTDKKDSKVAPLLPMLSTNMEPEQKKVNLPQYVSKNVGQKSKLGQITVIGSEVTYGTIAINGGQVVLDGSFPDSTSLGKYQILRVGVTSPLQLFQARRINNHNYWVRVSNVANISLEFIKGGEVWTQFLTGDLQGYLNNVPPLKNHSKYEDLGNMMWRWVGDPLVVNIGIRKSYGVFTSYDVNLTGYRPINQDADEDSQDVTFVHNPLGQIEGDEDKSSSLPIGELIREVDPETRFGGTTKEAILNNLWVPSSDPYPLIKGVYRTPDGVLCDANGNPSETPVYEWMSFIVPYRYGDTWYTRYDCIKTYPFTDEDTNQVVEIGSFMLESHINLDGRYDTKRGLLDNTQVKLDSYKLNEVYSQSDNFFNSRVLPEDYNKLDRYPYQLTWTLSKNASSDIDPWTNITLANTLDLPSSKGKITKIINFNDSLLCFQEKAFNQIMYNSRVQVQSSDGVPIEIANSGRVEGYRVLSNQIGCNNKWSLIETSTGLYFIDRYSNAVYKYGDGIANLSDTLGMTQWVKSLDNTEWNIYNENSMIGDLPGVRVFYDNGHGDVYFSPASSHKGGALCFSEKLNQFTSFMSYDNTEAMFNFDNGFYAIKSVKPGLLALWENFTGYYGVIFDTPQDFSITYISNGDSVQSKVFDTVELEAQVERVDPKYNEAEIAPYWVPPIRAIKATNDYQEAYKELDLKDIKKKFNVWRVNIPRSSEVASPRGDIRRDKFARARIRSPWTKITLYGNTSDANKITLYNTSTKYSI